MYITIEDKTFSFADIKEWRYFLSPLSKYSLQTLDFCAAWLQGQQTFNFQTSGSTGKPKMITLTRQQMQLSTRATAAALGLSVTDRALVCINTEYIGGKMMLVRALEIGMSMQVIPPMADPWEYGVLDFTFAALVPLQVQALLAAEQRQGLPRVKAIIIGGASILSHQQDALRELVAPVYATYGMTETASHVALQRLNGAIPSDYFRAVPGIQFAQDSRGCLQICGNITHQEWLTTNDVVELLDNQRFRWLGRADNVINSGGIKIQLEYIEQSVDKVFLEIGLTAPFFAAALPHDTLGEALVLLVEHEPLPTVQEEKILEILSKYLKKYEMPKKIIYLPKFSRTETEKINRKVTLSKISAGLSWS